MIPPEKATQIAKEWIDAWNRHDLDSILSHYAENVEFTSPFVDKLMGELSCTIKGKNKLSVYFGKGLEAYPGLNFELLNILTGVKSLTLYYKSVEGMLAAEVMFLDSEGSIERVIVHYTPAK
jgi:SnoaL-like domain